MIDLKRMGSGRKLLMRVFSLSNKNGSDWFKSQQDSLNKQKNTRPHLLKDNKK